MIPEPRDRPPALAVIVPTLDEASALPALLDRLLRAADPDDRAAEVVVADGGSEDDTPRLAESGGARLVRAARGRGAQLAAGAGAARAGLLLFLHADCCPAPGALAALRRAFADPALLAAGMRQRVDAEGWFFRAVERAANARVRRGVVLGDSGLCVRRGTYEAAGGFRPLALFEDIDLSRRLARQARVARIEDAQLVVSPRRWRREGALRCTLRNWMLRSMYRLGIEPERLAGLYPPHRLESGSP